MCPRNGVRNVNRKNPKGKTNQAEDVASTQKTPSSQIHVSNRPILGHDSPANASLKDTPKTEPSTNRGVSPSTSTVVIPVNADGEEISVSLKQTTAKDKEPKASDDDSAKDDAAEDSTTSSDEKTQDAPTGSSKTEQQNSSSTTSPDEAEDDADIEPDKPNPETEKAAKEAAEAAERERKLQDYTDSRQFFVPINAVAQGRSIKVSIGLTILLLLLAIILIDLMLDTGIVLLLQKVPHTHFFNLAGK